MVFFCCSNCGTALKKNQVEKHMGSCGKLVSCMDCQKEFRGNEYQSHTKCISEQEKYSAPDWKPPSSHNKGERKQLAWVETVNAVLENGKNNMRPAQVALLKAVAKHDNVPRKKAKFLNFTHNIARNNFDQQTTESVFDLLEAEWKRQAELNKPPTASPQKNGTEEVKEPESTTNGHENGTNGIEENEDEGNKKKKKSKKNKRKHEDEGDEENVEAKKKKDDSSQEDPEAQNEADENGNTSSEFRWGDIIHQILISREGNSISLKKLKKKVFAEYYARVGDSKGVKSKEDLAAQLNKKLKKKKFKVVGETVQLAITSE